MDIDKTCHPQLLDFRDTLVKSLNGNDEFDLSLEPINAFLNTLFNI